MSNKLTPSQIIQNAIQANLTDLNTSIPGIVTGYDASTQTASIQPAIRTMPVNGNFESLPLLEDVPIVFPRSGSASFHFPLKAGDSVLLIFSQRSIDNWQVTGEESDPAFFHQMSMSDAIAIPGLYPDADPIVVDESQGIQIKETDGNNIVIKSSSVELTINGSGTISLKADKIELDAGMVDIGSNATFHSVQFEDLKKQFDRHFHQVPQAMAGVLPSQKPTIPLLVTSQTRDIRVKD